MSWNIQKPGDYINGPLTVVGVAQFNSNVGVGVAPSAWNSNYNAIDIGANGSVSGRLGASNTVDITSNAFRNSAGDWVYKLAASNPACRYQADGSTGAHYWYSGVAGTAGNTITGFSTPTMSLDANGALLLPLNYLQLQGNQAGWPTKLILGNSDNGGYGVDIAWTVNDYSNNAFYSPISLRSTFSGGVVGGSVIFRGKRLSTSSIIDVLTIYGGGAVQVNSGNLLIGQAGAGIDFSASPNAAGSTSETLNDYEEGTFTPIVRGGSVAGTATYSVQVGRYTKTGNRVSVDIYVNWSGHTGTGPMQIAGLPFAAKTLANYYASASFGYIGGIPLNANNVLMGSVYATTSFIDILQYPVGGGTAGNVAMDTDGGIIVSVSYEV